MQRTLTFLSLHLAFQDWTEVKTITCFSFHALSEETQMTDNKKLFRVLFRFETGSYYVCQADLQLFSFCLRLFLELELQSCTSMPNPTVDVWINPDWLCLFAFHFLVLRKPFGPNIGVKKSGEINFCTVEYGKLHGDPPNAWRFSVTRLEWSLPNITEVLPPWKLCSVDHFWKDRYYSL